ncbi:hypothetical protein [Hymenobacter rubripertinctus]|uniref:Uncharacterized protein n=1 Tax=Hymenobacter rubripertinctus TaxID=2029981 RepID=A0A418R308_9BACT|nr:hypothetical protein [Hymenobacter rubripertinctus]RIY11779.1 hypothetical protein D0T11_06365 [Hymenobacter rubripertinctus]
MKKINTIVRDNYERYTALIAEPKRTAGPGLDLSQKKGTNKVLHACQIPVIHSDDPIDLWLIAEIRIDRLHDFKFKLRAPSFMGEPLLNYDSAGPTHRNEGVTSLPEQIVTTPHFNCYDQQGRRIAYKTAPLTNPEVVRELEDIDRCVIHFYEETRLTHDPAGYPAISLTAPGTLPFAHHTNADPHAHVVRFV